MPLVVTCACGKRLQLKESLAGKRIRCPECQEVLTVPAAADEEPDEEAAPKKSPAKPAGKATVKAARPTRRSDPEEEDAEDEQPRGKQKGKKKGKQAEKSSSNLLLILGVGAAILVLAGGVVAVLLIMNAPADPKKPGPQADNKGGDKKVKANNKGDDKNEKGSKPADKQKGTATTDELPTGNLVVFKPRTQLKLDLGQAGSNAAKVETLLLSADGSRVALSNHVLPKSKLQVWDLTGQPKKLFESDGHLAAFSPDGKRLVRSGSFTSEIVAVEGGQKLGEIGFGRVSFRSPDVVVCVLTDPLQVTDFDGATGKINKSFKSSDTSFIKHAATVKEGKELIVGLSASGQLKVWDVSTQKPLREIPLAGVKEQQTWLGYTYSPDGKWLALQVGNEPTAKIFNTTDGAVAATLPRGVLAANSAFFPNREIFLSPSSIARSDKKAPDIIAYDFTKQSVAAVFRGLENWECRVAVSEDGRVLAAADQAGNLLVWDLTQLK